MKEDEDNILDCDGIQPAILHVDFSADKNFENQLSLPFIDSPYDGVLNFLAMDDLIGRRIIEFIMSAKPQIVIDFRFVRPFDRPPLNRSVFFNMLQSKNIDYIHFSTPFHALSMKDVMAGYDHHSVNLNYELNERSPSDVVLLTPKRQDYRILATLLNPILAKGQKKWKYIEC